jgi:hypothetical protein
MAVPVNPDINDIFNRAHYASSRAIRRLSMLQYRIGEITGEDRLDKNESSRLSDELCAISWNLYSGVVWALPDINEIADSMKYAFATATMKLAGVQYRLAELAGMGNLERDESDSLQQEIVGIWEDVYAGTLCAVRDEDADESVQDQADNTYSDGREVRIKIQIEPFEECDFVWEHNPFLLGDGAVAEHPLGTICCILPARP